MAKKFPLAAQEEILRLKRQVFSLEQRIGRLIDKHKKEIAKLQEQKRDLVLSQEQLEQIRALRKGS